MWQQLISMNFKKISIQDRKKKNCITLDHTEPGEKATVRCLPWET